MAAKKRRTILKPFLILMALAGLCLSTIAAAESDRTITVTGEGRVETAPDMATIHLGVTQQADTAQGALSLTSTAVARVLDRLSALGLQAPDIQTQGLRLSPVWSNRHRENSEPAKITGYVASNMVFVRVRDLDALGQILDGVTAEGANEFNGLQFSVQNSGPLEDAARKAAVEDAVKRAQTLADAAGIKLGPVIQISDLGGNRPMPRMMEMSAARDSGVPVAPGSVSVEASVSMVFLIEP
jgi:uncharacterized protein YggE